MATNITVENVRKEIKNYCKSDNFEKNVKTVINNPSFFEVIIQDILFRQQVDNRVDQIIPNRINNYLNQHLKSIVSSEVRNCIVDSHIFQTELQTHKNSLKSELETTVSNIMKKIVSSDGYMEVTRAHLQAIDTKGEEQISRQHQQFLRHLEELSATTKSEMRELHNNLALLDSQKKEIDQLKSHTTYTHMCLFTLSGVSLGLIYNAMSK